MNLTVHELTGLAVCTAVTLLAALFLGAVCLWQQEKEIRRHDADLDAVWSWCIDAAAALGWTDDEDGPDGGGDPGPDEPDPPPPGHEIEDTVISHPADTFARKAALLARYVHTGQHRT